jgi:hypothetical protein
VADDPFTLFIEAIKDVVIDRNFETEPGKGEMQAVNKAAFCHDVKVPKLLGRNFQGIKDVSAKQPGQICTAVCASSHHLPYCRLLINMACRNRDLLLSKRAEDT